MAIYMSQSQPSEIHHQTNNKHHPVLRKFPMIGTPTSSERPPLKSIIRKKKEGLNYFEPVNPNMITCLLHHSWKPTIKNVLLNISCQSTYNHISKYISIHKYALTYLYVCLHLYVYVCVSLCWKVLSTPLNLLLVAINISKRESK